MLVPPAFTVRLDQDPFRSRDETKGDAFAVAARLDRLSKPTPSGLRSSSFLLLQIPLMLFSFRRVFPVAVM